MKLVKLNKELRAKASLAGIDMKQLVEYCDEQGDIGIEELMSIKRNLESLLKDIESAITGRRYG